MREQVFDYRFTTPKDGDEFIMGRDLSHAIGNSDQYPLGACVPRDERTEEWQIQDETLHAVINAVNATPKYKVRKMSVVNRWELVSRLFKDCGENLSEKSLSPLQVIAMLQGMAKDELILTESEDYAAGCICDDCQTGRDRGCPQASGRHYDAWGEGLGKPDYCPQKMPDELPF